MRKYSFSKPTELMVWKDSECEDCEFSLSCPQGYSNIKICFEEDGLSSARTRKALIKRTIRFISRSRKKERRRENKNNIKNHIHLYKESRIIDAVVNCSDIKEYVACQKQQ